MSEQLRRLVIEFGRVGIQTRVLYRSKDGPTLEPYAPAT